MRKKVWLNRTSYIENQLILEGETTEQIGELSPSGQLIVDSDELSFVYLAEEGDEYTYLYLPDFIWEELKTAMDKENEIFVHIGNNKMPLIQLKDEIEYLIFNIEGNSNYGEEMVNKVESIFISADSNPAN
ncbi:hypothetical protein E2R51_06230 [Jeotgalibacillus sp. S-D1]|uniref:UPF0738 family protein n=1 Tax=Jeotgalibacillus sp. S-D1 TaxID=2552189 RepID=UPI00105A87CB|nr:hypothetical protein [Jeotgalibacillus sp. S-D1]TDL35306.1 hypothetical protein E2R51_06230 [Jeotgalibacillus sp. S-D1]